LTEVSEGLEMVKSSILEELLVMETFLNDKLDRDHFLAVFLIQSFVIGDLSISYLKVLTEELIPFKSDNLSLRPLWNLLESLGIR